MLSKVRAAVVVALLVLTAGVVPAVSAGATGPGDASEFRLQAGSAGLTTAQARFLDERSAYYVATMGGERVSLNQVDVDGTATVSIALPGEEHPRDFSSYADVDLAGPPCVEGEGAPYRYFCAYANWYLTGDSIAMYNCVFYRIPWVSEGSWDNNQTAGTQPLLAASNGGSERLPGAYSYRLTGVAWLYVTHIKPCD